jgi:hypothetical protein
MAKRRLGRGRGKGVTKVSPAQKSPGVSPIVEKSLEQDDFVDTIPVVGNDIVEEDVDCASPIVVDSLIENVDCLVENVNNLAENVVSLIKNQWFISHIPKFIFKHFIANNLIRESENEHPIFN